MTRIVWALAAFAVLAIETQAADSILSGDAVILRVRTTVESASRSMTASSTIISTLNTNDRRETKAGDYRLILSVTDFRNGEYSILIVLKDSSEQPLDSATVLVEPGNRASFEFNVGEDKVSGSISVSPTAKSTEQ